MNDKLDELLFQAKGFWEVWFDVKRDQFFLLCNEGSTPVCSFCVRGALVGKRKAANPEKFGCIYLGRL